MCDVLGLNQRLAMIGSDPWGLRKRKACKEWVKRRGEGKSLLW